MSTSSCPAETPKGSGSSDGPENHPEGPINPHASPDYRTPKMLENLGCSSVAECLLSTYGDLSTHPAMHIHKERGWTDSSVYKSAYSSCGGPVGFPASALKGSQLPVTLAPGRSHTSGLCTPVQIPICIYTVDDKSKRERNRARHGGASFQSQYSAGKGRWISVSSGST